MQTKLKRLDPSTNGQSNGQVQPAGSIKTVAESGLVHLYREWHCDNDRTTLYREVDGDNGTVYSKHHQGGMPRLLSISMTAKRPQNNLVTSTIYEIEWSSFGFPSCKFSQDELDKGQWLSRFPGVAATSRSERDFYANIVKAQIDAFGIIPQTLHEHTGFYRRGDIWPYVLRDGREIPASNSTPVPIHNYNFSSKDAHYNAWVEHMATLPGAVTAGDVSRHMLWCLEVDPTGKLLLLCLAAYRSLITTFVHPRVCILVVADDSLDINDGASGAGKTSEVDYARAVDGPTPHRAGGECSFRGTATAIETRIAPFHDTLVSVSDFHLPEDASERDLRSLQDKVDKLASSAYDDTEMRERSNTELGSPEGTKVKCLTVMDGEKLIRLSMSRLRRVIILQYKRGDINTDMLHGERRTYQSIHTATGHTIIRWVQSNVSESVQQFIKLVTEKEAAFETEILARIPPGVDLDKEYKKSLAEHYSRLVCGAWIVEQATGVTGIVDSAVEFSVKHAIAQMSLMAHGGPSQIDREWVIHTTNMLLESGQGHGRDMNEKPLEDGKHGVLQIHGYKPTTSIDTPWVASGKYLYNLSEDGESYWFRPEVWQEELRLQARKDGKQWTLNKQTFPSAMVRLGIAVPGPDGRNCQRPYIANRQQRRLSVDCDTLFHYIDDDEKSGLSGLSGLSDTSYGSTGQSSMRPLYETALGDDENSGLIERSHENVFSDGSISQSTDNMTAKTAKTANFDSPYNSDPFFSADYVPESPSVPAPIRQKSREPEPVSSPEPEPELQKFLKAMDSTYKKVEKVHVRGQGMMPRQQYIDLVCSCFRSGEPARREWAKHEVEERTR